MVVPSDREKEIFLFAALFFYFEYVVHSVIESIFRDPRTQTETDSRWAIDELNMLPKKGEHVDFFMERIFANEEIIKYLEFLRKNSQRLCIIYSFGHAHIITICTKRWDIYSRTSALV